jgi:hypothetical protein
VNGQENGPAYTGIQLGGWVLNKQRLIRFNELLNEPLYNTKIGQPERVEIYRDPMIVHSHPPILFPRRVLTTTAQLLCVHSM